MKYSHSQFGICLIAVMIASYSQAKPPALETLALIPENGQVLGGVEAAWKDRAMAWYQSDQLKARRRQMRDMSRPLKRSCYYCHTRDFKGYEQSTYLISLQMMAVSAEQNVACSDCHLGRRGLSELGAKSLIQWRFAVREGLDCQTCHAPGGKFKKLTERGEQSRQSLAKEVKLLGSSLGINQTVVQRLADQVLSEKTKVTSSDQISE